MRHRGMEIDLSRAIAPIRGGSFTVRTFADNSFGFRQGTNYWPNGHRSIDRLVTVTLSAISGECHTIVPSMEVKL